MFPTRALAVSTRAGLPVNLANPCLKLIAKSTRTPVAKTGVALSASLGPASDKMQTFFNASIGGSRALATAAGTKKAGATSGVPCASPSPSSRRGLASTAGLNATVVTTSRTTSPTQVQAKYHSFGMVPVVFPSTTNDRHVISVSSPVHLSNLRFLMIREKRGGHWTFNKGGIEFHDRHPWATALRELEEEVTMTLNGRRLHLEDLRVQQLLDGQTFDETRWRPGRWHRLSRSLLSSNDNDIDTYGGPSSRHGFFKRNSFFVVKLQGLSTSELPHLSFCQHELLAARWVRGDKVLSLLTHKETKDMFSEVLSGLEREHGVSLAAEPVAQSTAGRQRRLSQPGIIATDSKLNISMRL